MDFEALEVNYIAGTPFVGAKRALLSGPRRPSGRTVGRDPVARRKVWSIPETFPVWSGTLTTAGDVVFYGTMEGWFKAIDARTGELLWQFKTGDIDTRDATAALGWANALADLQQATTRGGMLYVFGLP